MLTQIFSCTILIALIFCGIYTLRVIKIEKTHFKYFSKAFPLLHFRLLIPPWWGVTIDDQQLPALRFERKGKKYDWYAYFTWKANPEKKSLKVLAENWMKSEGIVTDEDHAIIEKTEREHTEDFFRIEGTATQNDSERIYLDLCLIKDSRFEKYFFAENKSSVLNGSVESAYFEEVLKHLECMS